MHIDRTKTQTYISYWDMLWQSLSPAPISMTPLRNVLKDVYMRWVSCASLCVSNVNASPVLTCSVCVYRRQQPSYISHSSMQVWSYLLLSSMTCSCCVDTWACACQSHLICIFKHASQHATIFIPSNCRYIGTIAVTHTLEERTGVCKRCVICLLCSVASFC